MPAEHRVDLEVALERVTARLQRRFDQVDPSVVEAAVRQSAAEFQGARAMEFVPVFVERHSAEALSPGRWPRSVGVRISPTSRPGRTGWRR